MQYFQIPHKDISLEGLAFYEREGQWNRLPQELVEKLKDTDAELYNLSFHTAGAMLRFATDAQKVSVKVDLRGPAYMSHMPATGICGVDLYARALGSNDSWQFKGVSKFGLQDKEYEFTLAECLPEKSEVLLALPLYMGIHGIEVGINEEASLFDLPTIPEEHAIAFYGTSITQGGCASRPGMAYPAILRRKWNLPIYNFGFSGNGTGDPSLAQYLINVPNLSCFVIDIEANAGPRGILEENLKPFVEEIRKRREDLVIIFMTGTKKTIHNWNAEGEKAKRDYYDIYKNLYDERVAAGDKKIFFFDGNDFDEEIANEFTVDGIHLTDLGFYHLAKKLAPFMEEILTKELGIQLK